MQSEVEIVSEKVLVTRSSMPDFNEYCDEIKKLWDSHWLTNMGIEHQEFQIQLEKYLDCPNVILFTNGHLALENIISSMQFPKGGEVITTPFTFVSTTHAIARNGLIPVFCDVNPIDYTIDVNKLESLITDKTVAILPVHVYGNICDVDAIDKIAAKYNLKVIYDAAHAFAVKYKGVSVANYGDATMFSFHATKVFNTIEGGAACFKDKQLIETLNDLKNFGIRGPENVVFIGGNAKMSEFQAAMGICNLRHIETEISKRKLIVDRYKTHLENIKGIRLCKSQKDVESNYAYFPVVFDGYKASRDCILDELKKHSIFARKYFYPLTNCVEAYSDLSTAGAEKTPIAAYLAERVITLPLYADLSLKDVDRICEIVLSIDNY